MNQVDFWSPVRDRFFDEFLTPLREGAKGANFNPACDVEEDEGGYLISFDVPGIKRENVKIELHQNQLVVTGERREERHDDKRTRHFSQRGYGQFHRTFTLPTQVNPEKIEAAFQDGVFKIHVPKVESVKPRTIKISEGKSGLFSAA